MDFNEVLKVSVLKFSFIYLINLLLYMLHGSDGDSFFELQGVWMYAWIIFLGIVCDAGLKSSIEIHCIVVHAIDERLESCSSHLDFSKLESGPWTKIHTPIAAS